MNFGEAFRLCSEVSAEMEIAATVPSRSMLGDRDDHGTIQEDAATGMTSLANRAGPNRLRVRVLNSVTVHKWLAADILAYGAQGQGNR